MTDGFSRRPPGRAHGAAAQKGRSSDSAGGGTGYGNEENATPNALTEHEAEALIPRPLSSRSLALQP